MHVSSYARYESQTVDLMRFHWLLQFKHVSTKATPHTTVQQDQTENQDTTPGEMHTFYQWWLDALECTTSLLSTHSSPFLHVHFQLCCLFRKLHERKLLLCSCSVISNTHSCTFSSVGLNHILCVCSQLKLESTQSVCLCQDWIGFSTFGSFNNRKRLIRI